MKTLNWFDDWSVFEKSWLGTFTLINIYLFFAWDDTVVGLLASLTGMVCVILVAKGKTMNYYFGLVNVLLYSYIAWNNKFYGEVTLNMMYYLPMQFIGLYYWKMNENEIKDTGVVILQKLSTLSKIFWMLLAGSSVVTYWLFLKLLGGNLPFADSVSTVLSIFAMFLMVKRVTEQWILWIIVDIVAIYMWLTVFLKEGNDVSMLVMWSAFLINAIYGYYNWKKMERQYEY